MPPNVIFGCCSGFAQKYNETPADYDKVYVYSEKQDIEEIKNRFPLQRKGYMNLVVLESDPWLKNFGKITPDCQTFVDLWNLAEWYAKDFLNTLNYEMGL